jgi:hypothetical protein
MELVSYAVGVGQFSVCVPGADCRYADADCRYADADCRYADADCRYADADCRYADAGRPGRNPGRGKVASRALELAR